MPISTIEQQTGKLYGGLWSQYDADLFAKSLDLFKDRWLANNEPADFFQGKRCLDVGCGGGRYSLAMAHMGAKSVVGVDVSESGLKDAAMRGEHLGYSNVTFRQATALELPFNDGEFDFVCCAGVLHHTRSVERGLREIHRVLKPGGCLYMLLYGAGGVFWPLNALLRPFAALIGQDNLDVAVENAGYAANKRRSVLDDLFVPILETYTRERVDQLLSDAGFNAPRRWTSARLDHETDANTMLVELESRVKMWEAGYQHTTDPRKAAIQLNAANLCRTVISAVRDLIEQNKAGQLSAEQLQNAVVGHGHHRFTATRS